MVSGPPRTGASSTGCTHCRDGPTPADQTGEASRSALGPTTPLQTPPATSAWAFRDVERDQSDERSKACRTAGRGGQGERYVSDAVHPKVHRSVHLAGERKSREALRLRGTRRLILDAGKTPDWAGATPLLAKGLWPKDHRGRSSPVLDRDKGSA